MKKLYTPKNDKMRIAVLLSGSGSTARYLIQKQGKYKVACLFSDNPESNANKIAGEFKIPVRVNDIKEFYRKKGFQNTKDMKVRKEFDKLTQEWLKKNSVDVVALAGYMSLVTEPICDSFVTLNSHPADLTIKENGRRKYVGAHSVYDCIKDGLKEIRTSIIWVNLGCDEGPILVRSKSVMIPNTDGLSEEQMKEFANKVQEDLKKKGDYPAYVAALELLADGRIEADDRGNVYIDGVPDGIEVA
ncbi:MAG: hypothetical protein EPN86_03240 [Nanoarchaeota archaeon]|nr:MAG: hypothetical protein EPN86_03240 [Nanoarchaeota archaeon]